MNVLCASKKFNARLFKYNNSLKKTPIVQMQNDLKRMPSTNREVALVISGVYFLF